MDTTIRLFSFPPILSLKISGTAQSLWYEQLLLSENECPASFDAGLEILVLSVSLGEGSILVTWSLLWIPQEFVQLNPVRMLMELTGTVLQ